MSWRWSAVDCRQPPAIPGLQNLVPKNAESSGAKRWCSTMRHVVSLVPRHRTTSSVGNSKEATDAAQARRKQGSHPLHDPQVNTVATFAIDLLRLSLRCAPQIVGPRLDVFCLMLNSRVELHKKQRVLGRADALDLSPSTYRMQRRRSAHSDVVLNACEHDLQPTLTRA